MARHCTYYTARAPGLPATSRQRIVAWVGGSQAEADTRATAQAAETAYQGAVSDDVDVGWWLTASGAGAGTVAAALPASEISADTRRKRAAARRVHVALQGWATALAAEGVTHAASIVAVGHDYLWRAHQACYLVMTHGTWTVAQLEAWAGQMALGAADVTSPATFFSLMEGGGTPLSAPTRPAAWVRFSGTGPAATAERVNLADAETASGTRRSGGGEGNLDLQASQLPAGGIPADGSWIDSLI